MQDHDNIVSGKLEYVAEMIVELPSSSAEFARLCETLRNELGTEILTVGPTQMGIRITCRVADYASFLSSVPHVPSIGSWRLSPG